MFVGIVLVALLGALHSSRSEEVPLRGYVCKNNAQHAHKPCDLCPPGSYCLTEALARPCGAIDIYCPIGSVEPTKVSDGYYTIPEDADETERSDQEECQQGYYCSGGIKRICPKGFYCPTKGLMVPIACGNSTVFCEEGATSPTQVTKGYFSIGGSNSTTRDGQQISPLGHYAIDGIVHPCQEGHYGSELGLSADGCSGICEAGFYCPVASIDGRQVACGRSDLFCPAGSASPAQVRDGYFSATEDEPCPPGTFFEPFPDEEAGVSPIETSLEEGECVLCPEGTYKHFSSSNDSCLDCGTKARSTPDRRTCVCHQSATERARGVNLHYDVTNSTCYHLSDGVLPPPHNFQRPGTHITKFREMECEKGHYCKEGIMHKCPGGRFGDIVSETNEECSGPCMAGHWCGEGRFVYIAINDTLLWRH